MGLVADLACLTKAISSEDQTLEPVGIHVLCFEVVQAFALCLHISSIQAPQALKIGSRTECVTYQLRRETENVLYLQEC